MKFCAGYFLLRQYEKKKIIKHIVAASIAPCNHTLRGKWLHLFGGKISGVSS